MFFISDTHFYHKNVIKYSNRPFDSVDQMNACLIDNWNSKVGKTDDVYFLGDFSFGTKEETQNIINNLNGKKHMILGNHDKPLKGSSGLESVRSYHRLKVQDSRTERGIQDIVLFHYPILSWEKRHYGAWHLFGHCHGSLTVEGLGKCHDAGVDNNNYSPLSYDEVYDIMKDKNFVQFDHHIDRRK